MGRGKSDNWLGQDDHEVHLLSDSMAACAEAPRADCSEH